MPNLVDVLRWGGPLSFGAGPGPDRFPIISKCVVSCKPFAHFRRLETRSVKKWRRALQSSLIYALGAQEDMVLAILRATAQIADPVGRDVLELLSKACVAQTNFCLMHGLLDK